MKKILTLVAAFFTLLAGAQNTYTNPILHLDYSDPDVCRVGDDYWMTASSFNCFPGLPVLHSRDLVHWEQVGSALESFPGFSGQVLHGCGVWAPAIRYHDGWYYIFWGDPDRGIFMVRTEDPRGRWEAPVCVVEGKGLIDPCPMWDDDGRAWLSHGCAGSRAGLKSVLFIAEMSPDGTRLLEPSRIVFDGHETQPTIEGTKLYRRGGYYYIFAPAGGVSTGWQTVLRSASPYGPYEERVVLASSHLVDPSGKGESDINGPHQGAWVDTPEGEDWFIHFQDKGAYGRIVHLQPMSWSEDGWPVVGINPDPYGVGHPVISYRVPYSVSSVYGDRSVTVAGDLFAGAEYLPYGLPQGWQYPSVPSPYWHYALPEGGIRLFSNEYHGAGLWDCPSLLLRKFSAESFTVTAHLVFIPNPQLKEKGEIAGFIVFGNDYAGIQMVDTIFGCKVQYVECKGASKGSAPKVRDIFTAEYQTFARTYPYSSPNVPAVSYPDIDVMELYVKLEVSPRRREGDVPDAVCRFSYSLDGTDFRRAGSEFIATPELWVGARWGFFCLRTSPKNDSGHLDILDLTVR